MYLGHTQYYENGIPKKEYCTANGNVQGIVKLFDEEGIMTDEIEYLNNRKQGYHKLYFPNGKLKVNARYEKGMQNGQQENFRENGDLKSKTYYHNDELFMITVPLENGEERKSKDSIQYHVRLNLISDSVMVNDTIELVASFPKNKTLLSEQDSVFFRYDITNDSTGIFNPRLEKLIENEPIKLNFLAEKQGISYLFGFLTIVTDSTEENHALTYQKIVVHELN